MIVTYTASLYGGEILRSNVAIEAVREQAGPDHVRFCTACGQTFFANREQTLCFADAVVARDREIADIYDDVFEALGPIPEIDAYMTSTGGGCMAIRLDLDLGPGHFLLTDSTDTLSWDRDVRQGWALGYYPDDLPDDEVNHEFPDSLEGTIPSLKVEHGMLVHPIKDAAVAAAMVSAAITHLTTRSTAS